MAVALSVRKSGTVESARARNTTTPLLLLLHPAAPTAVHHSLPTPTHAPTHAQPGRAGTCAAKTHLTYESQMTHFPSHFSQRRPMAMPGCLRHMIRSGWCFAIPPSSLRHPSSRAFLYVYTHSTYYNDTIQRTHLRSCPPHRARRGRCTRRRQRRPCRAVTLAWRDESSIAPFRCRFPS